MVGWIKMPLDTEVGLGPGHIVLDGTQLPPQKGTKQSPTFRPMFTVAKRSPISTTAELVINNQWVCFFEVSRLPLMSQQSIIKSAPPGWSRFYCN